MDKKVRQSQILTFLKLYGKVPVKMLRDEFGVTDMTIRRDLADLSERGLILREHGYVMRKVRELVYDDDYVLAHLMDQSIVNSLAYQIAQHIVDKDVIFLGHGDVLTKVPHYLFDKDVTIVTNSFAVFTKASSLVDGQAYLVGGRYQKSTGTFAAEEVATKFRELQFTKAFVESTGVDEDAVTVENRFDSKVYMQAFSHARERYVVTSFDYLNHFSRYPVIRLSETDGLFVNNVHAVEPPYKHKVVEG